MKPRPLIGELTVVVLFSNFPRNFAIRASTAVNSVGLCACPGPGCRLTLLSKTEVQDSNHGKVNILNPNSEFKTRAGRAGAGLLPL